VEIGRKTNKAILRATGASSNELWRPVKHEDLHDEILAAERKLDNLGLCLRQRKHILDKFRENLKTWKDLHFRSMRSYKGRKE
jgi:hypothetical protein